MERADASAIMAYVKVTDITNRVGTNYGETYSAQVELMCQLKVDRGTILPEFFTITDLGQRPDGCPSREVMKGFQYIVFLQKDTPVVFHVDEINSQAAVVPDSWDNLQALTSYVQSCLTGNCRPAQQEGWTPMSEQERADIAEIIVKAKIIKRHQYGSTQGYYIAEAETLCEMKVPGNMNGGIGTSFNVTNVGALDGLCEDRHLTEGHEFIIFLARHFPFFPLPGQTVSPEQLENYVLGLDEVNSQHAIFNISQQTVAGFEEYLQDCENSTPPIPADFRLVSLALLLVSFLSSML